MRTQVAASVALFMMVALVSAPWLESESDQGVPHFNAGPPAAGAKLPPILTKDQLWGANAQYPYQTHAYELAAKIPKVLYQQPCYCYCQRKGHRSLLDCFKTDHAATCNICVREAARADQMHRKGKSADEIRRTIVQGQWASLGDSHE